MTARLTAPRKRTSSPRVALRPYGNPWLGPLARFGLACRGVVYLVIALLAVNLARGRSGAEADQRGALENIAHRPFGHLLVLAIAVGFACLALWQGVWAAQGRGRRATPGRRLVAAAKAIVYLALSAGAFAVFRNHAPSGGDQQAVDVTARVMRHFLGRTLVGVVGITMCVVGLHMISKAVRRRFDVEVKFYEMPARARRVFEAVGVVGMMARGVVVTLIGYFVLQAAVTFNPTRAKGLDGALRSLVHHRFGPLLLVVMAAGLACFGLFSLLEVRYARAEA